MEDRIWKHVVGYKGSYIVSNDGVIRSVSRDIKNNLDRSVVGITHRKGKELCRTITAFGYCVVKLYLESKKKTIFVHRLVAEAFIPNPQKLPYVNHKDGNKLNNNAVNLEWCTASQNTQHAYDNGLMNTKRGEQNYRSVLKDVDIPIIRQLNTDGLSHQKIADLYKCSKSTIQNVIYKRAWKHVLE